MPLSLEHHTASKHAQVLSIFYCHWLWHTKIVAVPGHLYVSCQTFPLTVYYPCMTYFDFYVHWLVHYAVAMLLFNRSVGDTPLIHMPTYSFHPSPSSFLEPTPVDTISSHVRSPPSRAALWAFYKDVRKRRRLTNTKPDG